MACTIGALKKSIDKAVGAISNVGNIEAIATLVSPTTPSGQEHVSRLLVTNSAFLPALESPNRQSYLPVGMKPEPITLIDVVVYAGTRLGSIAKIITDRTLT
jgi:hypothetical protein